MNANANGLARHLITGTPTPLGHHLEGDERSLFRAVAEARRLGHSALAAIRRVRGLGQGELAMHTGLRLSTIETIEATSLARIDEVESLARALRCPPDILP